jgi:Invasion associated locus B (IalB) protein
MKTILSAFFIISFVALPYPLTAQTLHLTSKHWRAFTVTDAGAQRCYMVSFPTAQAGNYRSRGEPFLMVTHLGSGRDEVSLSSGYPYRAGSDVSFSVDGVDTALFTKGDRAWAKDNSTDAALVSRMKQGTSAKAKGISVKGTHSLDSYSLSGFSAAYQKMTALCP